MSRVLDGYLGELTSVTSLFPFDCEEEPDPRPWRGSLMARDPSHILGLAMILTVSLLELMKCGNRKYQEMRMLDLEQTEQYIMFACSQQGASDHNNSLL